MKFLHLKGPCEIPIRDYTERQMFLNFQYRFATACGIALQGLGQVPFDVNLLPEQKAPFWNRLFKKKKVPAAWGFDFGNTCFKAVRLTFDDEGYLAVDQCIFCHHPFDGPRTNGETKTLSALSDTQIEQILKETEKKPNSPFMPDDPPPKPTFTEDQGSFVNSALELFLEKHEYQNEKICVGYPAHDILCGNVVLPQADPQKIWEALEYETKTLVPDTHLLYQTHHTVLGWEEDENNLMKQYIHYFAVKNNTIEKKLEALQNYGIVPDIMASNVLANLNYAYLLLSMPPAKQPTEFTTAEDDEEAEPEPPPAPEIKSILVCDMGTLGTDVILYSQREIRSSYVPIGGQDLTHAIANSLDEPFSMAEGIKRDPIKRTKNFGQAIESLKEVVHRLARETVTRLKHFQNDNIELDNLILLGGGFQLVGMGDFFKSVLGYYLKRQKESGLV